MRSRLRGNHVFFYLTPGSAGKEGKNSISGVLLLKIYYFNLPNNFDPAASICSRAASICSRAFFPATAGIPNPNELVPLDPSPRNPRSHIF